MLYSSFKNENPPKITKKMYYILAGHVAQTEEDTKY